MSGWRPALRIARRTVVRSPARSLLVALLVALPVAGATVVDVVARTFAQPERDVQRQIGSADATVSVTGYSRLRGSGSRSFVQGRKRRDPRSVDVRALLPPGSRIAPMPLVNEILVRRRKGVARPELVVADVREPLHRHEAELEDGRAPTRAEEVLVSRSLAERLDLIDDGGTLLPGAVVRLRDGPTAAVTGLAREQFCLSCESVVARAGSAVAKAASARHPSSLPGSYEGRSQPPTFLVDLPDEATVAELERALARQGIDLTARSTFLNPQTDDLDITSADLRAAALVAIIVGLGLLEVVLLAGTAFAVGARRQLRELGLVAANGASPRDVRRIVLAQGLVLGGLGAAIGVAAGAALAFAGRPLWERFMDEAVTTWSYAPWEILAVALVGLFSGLAAAVVPAVGAGRTRPVDALARRFRQGRSAGRRGMLIGTGLMATGALCGVAGDRLLAADFADYERALAAVARTGAYLSAPSADGPIALIVGGATLAVVGLVLLSPTLVGWLARLGARLPLSARLATRDAARHRHRTGPATGAITVAVTGSIALAFMVAGVSRGDELSHVARLPADVLAVEILADDGQTVPRAAEGAAAQLPDARRHVVRVPEGRSEYLELVPNVRDDCPASLAKVEGCGTFVESGELAVATTSGLADTVSAGRLDGAARAALAQGNVLVFNPVMLDRAGTVRVADGEREIRLPGHLVARGKAYADLPSALVPPTVVRAQRWKTTTQSALIRFAPGADQSAIDSAVDAANQAGVAAFVESGPSDSGGGRILLAVALVSALVTLLGVAISVALSAAEGRADLATMAAVGAPPHRRRMLAASQALVIGGLGCALGVALGTFVAFTARATTGSPDFVVPWGNLVATGIGVPLLAALVAALCTRSRLPLVPRAD